MRFFSLSRENQNLSNFVSELTKVTMTNYIEIILYIANIGHETQQQFEYTGILIPLGWKLRLFCYHVFVLDLAQILALFLE